MANAVRVRVRVKVRVRVRGLWRLKDMHGFIDEFIHSFIDVLILSICLIGRSNLKDGTESARVQEHRVSGVNDITGSHNIMNMAMRRGLSAEIGWMCVHHCIRWYTLIRG